MPEPEDILTYMENHISKNTPPYFGKKVVLTAGPTYEPIDPPFVLLEIILLVKWGFELAKRAAELGARVILISGPSAIDTTDNTIDLVSVVTADQMFEKCKITF